MGTKRSINAKTESVDGDLGKRGPAHPGQRKGTYPPPGTRTGKKQQWVLPARMLPEAARSPHSPTFPPHPSRNCHSQKTLEQEVRRTPKINKPTPTQGSGASLVKERGRSLGTAVDRGQGTLSGKFKVEKSIIGCYPRVFKDKKDNLFIFQKGT